MMTPRGPHVTGGVDTHGDVHVGAALDTATGRMLGTASFPTTTAGYTGLLGWLRGFGDLDRVGVESTGSYGAGLCRFLRVDGVEVIEVDRPDRKARRFDGKSDPIDAEAAARAVLSGRAAGTPKSRDGLVEAVRSWRSSTTGRSRTAPVRSTSSRRCWSAPPRRCVTASVGSASPPSWPGPAASTDSHTDPVERETRWALKELARRIGFLDDQTGRLEVRIGELAALASPALIGMRGVGPHVAAQLLAAAGDNPGRLRSEAAFAKLCGATTPPPAPT